MVLPAKRVLNFAAFLACAGMMAFALFAQHVLLLEPCPLCVLQRVAVIGSGIAFLVLALCNRNSGWVQRIFLALLGLFSLGGLVVAGRHVWLQHLPPDKVPSCGPGLGYMLDNFPFADALKMVFTGSGECAKIDWSLLGISMPGWVFIALLTLLVFGLWNNLARS
ncbi:MAG: disulfide bond formation protein B [Gammaproteobacteria bacterium]|nr:disulfide bond formation protein B [Gammaproteobacteria bacterium]MDH5303322.1 disulfide bond formation protein B [Gammaproteobacteria bacterium]MDH5323596.1 disulfide bond formation protein B [Gammaproteobacteria bacterium]